MPNFRELTTMPADGGDLVREIQRESGRRKFADLWGLDDLPQRDPALTAFERGNHAPAPAVLERAARLSGWTAHSGDACPVPHGTMVEIRTRGGLVAQDVVEAYSWRTDGTPCDIVEWRLATQEAAEAPKVGGWVMHQRDVQRITESPPVNGVQWVRLRKGNVHPYKYHIENMRINDDGSCLCWKFFRADHPQDVVAYSTDAECPPWPEAK